MPVRRTMVARTPVTPPSLSVNTSSVSFTGAIGATALQSALVTVTNGSRGDAHGLVVSGVSYTDGTGWLAARVQVINRRTAVVVFDYNPALAPSGSGKVATVTLTHPGQPSFSQVITITSNRPTLSPAVIVPNLSTTPAISGTEGSTALLPAAYVLVPIDNGGQTPFQGLAVQSISQVWADELQTAVYFDTNTSRYMLRVALDTTACAALTAGSYTLDVVLSDPAAVATATVHVPFVQGPRVKASMQVMGSNGSAVQDAAIALNGAVPTSEVWNISSGGLPLNAPFIKAVTWRAGNTLPQFGTASLVGSQVVFDYDAAIPTWSSPGDGWVDIDVDDLFALTPQRVSVYFRYGTATPQLSLRLSTANVAQTVNAGQLFTTQQVTVQNAGVGGLSALGAVTVAWETANPTWVSATYDALSGVITLTYAGTALPVGQYLNALLVSCSAIPGRTERCDVQGTVQAANTIALLRYPLPTGVTQNMTTGAISGIPVGCLTAPPAHYGAAATYVATDNTTLQAAFDNSRTVDNPVIEIASGANISGNFIIRSRSGAGRCVVRSSTNLLLPPPGTRVHPTTDAANLATITTPNSSPALRFLSNANDYFFHGIQTKTQNTSTTVETCFIQVFVAPCVFSGGNYILDNLADQSNQPQNIAFHQCVGFGTNGTRRGFYVTAKYFQITDSWIGGYTSAGFEGQGVNIPYGGKSYFFDNSFIQGRGECLLVGGVPLPFNDYAYNPTDIYERRCHFRAEWSWMPFHPSYDGITGFKNLHEYKRGVRALMDGCVLNQGGVAGQAGIQIVFKSDNNGGNSNPVQSCSRAIQMIDCYGYDLQRPLSVGGTSSPAQGQTIPNDQHHFLNCIFFTINKAPNNSTGYLLECGNNSTNIDFEKLAIVQNGGNTSQGMFSFLGGKVTNLRVQDCILPKGTYGISSNAGQFGLAALIAKCVGYSWSGNVHPGSWTTAEKTNMPPGNYFPTAESAIGYTTYPGTGPADFTLGPLSAYLHTDQFGGPAGPDCARIAARTAGVQSP